MKEVRLEPLWYKRHEWHQQRRQQEELNRYESRITELDCRGKDGKIRPQTVEIDPAEPPKEQRQPRQRRNLVSAISTGYSEGSKVYKVGLFNRGALPKHFYTNGMGNGGETSKKIRSPVSVVFCTSVADYG